MPRFLIHTTETVHAVYNVECDTLGEAARMVDEQPEKLTNPSVYEATDMELDRVEWDNENNIRMGVSIND